MSELYDNNQINRNVQNNQTNQASQPVMGSYSRVPDKSSGEPIVIGAAPRQEPVASQEPITVQEPSTVREPVTVQEPATVQEPRQGQNPQYPNQQYANPARQQQPVYGNPYAQNAQYRTPYYGGGQYPYPNGAAEAKTSGGRAKKSGRSTIIAVSIICAVCVILSAFAGIGGALLVRQSYGDAQNTQNPGANVSSGNTVSSSYSENDAGVIYKSVDSVVQSTDGTATIADVAAAVKDSVVEITTEYRSTSYFQYVTQGAGSGVIITSDGYIVTNNHVITGTDSTTLADSITVRLTDGSEYPATVIGTDSSSDIALIKIDAANLTPAIFGDSDKLVVGEETVVVGNPLGELGGTVTNGIISALDREIKVDGTTMNLLQTNAAVNPGNSGGGMFNMNGELVGIVNAKSSGSGIEGLGFAIPSNDASDIVDQLLEYGYVRGRVYIGVRFLDITDYLTAMSYRVNALGVYVISAEEGLNDGVLKNGDRVTAVDGTEVSTRADIKNILSTHEVGDKLTFTIAREGKMTDVTIECFEKMPSATEEVNFN